MGETETKKTKKRICAGLLAHVDAGKTTLSEALLYESGSIRKLGRVDNKDAHLDTYDLERSRGITIFSKQAVFETEQMQVTILDTPGHVDFSAEMERTLQVLDYAILVISCADGVQGHTQTLWQLLKKYKVPVFIFVNKMDQPGADANVILKTLKERLSDGCTDFSQGENETFFENIAMSDEALLDEFLETGVLMKEEIFDAILKRKVFPCYFGSALKLTGVAEFLRGFERYTVAPSYPKDFGARVFKIARDDRGERLTYMKITGGSLKVKALLSNKSDSSEDFWEEKVNQIRSYSGVKYEVLDEVWAGDVCAVTGLTKTYPGEGLGACKDSSAAVLEPVLTYKLILEEGINPIQVLPRLRQLEEEDPQLHMAWDEKLKEIQIQMMGEVQTEVLKSLIFERFGWNVSFGSGNIVYKETIRNTVEGVGHFEPLRHYAEVHLVMEPAKRGSGMIFETDCSEDMLDKNWQRLILTHLAEKEHHGVLTGAPVTDIKITLVAGRAHQKHTEGGDFRQATYRAVRQGLMMADVCLLEPYYEFRLEVPQENVGRAMADLDKMYGTFSLEEMQDGQSVLMGSVPVATMWEYQKEVASYTKGRGHLSCRLKGYDLCHNEDDVIEQKMYDPERDTEHPTGSVFCTHGAGFVVPWDEVPSYMHIESYFKAEDKKVSEEIYVRHPRPVKEEIWLGTEEIDQILHQTYNANKKAGDVRKSWKKQSTSYENSSAVTRTFKPSVSKEEYLLVDGYNIIFAWEDLSDLAKVSIDGARGQLMDILSHYQGIKKCHLILVFDAYRVAGHVTEILDYHNIHIVYTKEAETADQYIEKFAHQNAGKYRVTVATSDGLEQIIIRGQGCALISARELKALIDETTSKVMEDYEHSRTSEKNYLFEDALKAVKGEID